MLGELTMRLPWRRAAAAAALIMLCSCGSSGQAGVAIDTLQTNVIFGAGQGAQAHTSTAQGYNVAGQAGPPVAENAFPLPDNFTFPATSGAFFLPPFFGGLCPAASPTTFPAQPASSDVTTTPAIGAYHWAGAGSYDFTQLGLTIKFPMPQRFDQFVRNVKPFQDTFPQAGSPQGIDFTFDTVEPQPGNAKGTYIKLVWQVKSNAAITDPEGGLALVEVDGIDPKTHASTTLFKAAQHDGLLLLPLPAAPGPVAPGAASALQGLPVPVKPPASSTESVDTSGNGNTLQFNGSVGAPERVDACGIWLEAWPVDGTLIDGTGKATIHLDVATQLGALVIALNIDGSFFGATLHKATTHIGQAPMPAPIPPEWR